MDEDTVIALEAEIEELNRVDGISIGQDDTDGFARLVTNQLNKICGQSSSSASDPDGASGSRCRKDFQDHKTSLVAQETKQKNDFDNGDVYDFTHPLRGLAVIINNEDFEANSQFGARPGSSYDATALYQTFKKLGFTVLVKKNLTGNQMVELLKLAKDKYDHRQADCFVCSILTHGDEATSEMANDAYGTRVRRDLLFGTDGVPVLTSVIVELFNDKYCPGLKGKPRLFFLQACRGSKYDHGVGINVLKPEECQQDIDRRNRDQRDNKSSTVDQTDSRTTNRQKSFSSSVDPPQYHKHLSDSTDAKPAGSNEDRRESPATRVTPGLRKPSGETSTRNVKPARLRDVAASPTPLYKDCLVMYATPPGHYAWRRKNGAWFVQSLCEVLNSPLIGTVSLFNALVQAAGRVAINYQSENPANPQMHQKKEIPVIESMLVKDIFLTEK